MLSIIPYQINGPIIILSQQNKIAKQLSAESYLTFKFGLKSCKVKVKLSNSLNENNLLVSEHVLKLLKIPHTSKYSIRLQTNELIIGPYIGILAELTNQKLAILLPTLTSFLKYYNTIGGTIIAFSLEGINSAKQEITGYIFNPKTNKWVHGTYFYPSSILSITEASLTDKWTEFKEKMNHFEKSIGHTVFNYPSFSKWEMHEFLKHRFRHVLPETFKYQNIKEVKMLVQKHKSIYIKPINGRLGRFIYKVNKTSSGYIVKYRNKKKVAEKRFATENALLDFFKQKLIPGEYLLQEALPLVQHNNSVIDFRVMLARNRSGSWEECGFFSRYGAKGSAISNITAGGRAEAAELTLKKVWHLEEAEINRLKHKIINLCKDVLQVIEKRGFHCGNIGVDIAIDKNRNIWIIEINNQNPDPYIAIFAKRNSYFYKTRHLNMLYAKKLAGF